MKVIITSTSEITKVQVNKVLSNLQNVKGPISFEVQNYNFSDSIEKYTDDKLNGVIHEHYELETINSICNSFRVDKKISIDTILVVITSNKLVTEIALHKNILSFFYDRNIIVRDNNWIGCDKIDPNIILAHQIVENIFQVLSGLKFSDFSAFHFEPQTCINDFCNNEYELQYKIRSAHICISCLENSVINGMESIYLSQIQNLLSFFRDEISGYKSFLSNKKLDNIKINKDGDITIGGKEIKLTSITKTIYIFFLIYKGLSFRAVELKNYEKLLESIYLMFTNTDKTKPVQTLIGKGTDRPHTDTLKEHRYKIKKLIKEVLGNELSDLYKIGSYSKPINTITKYFSVFPKNTLFEVEIDEKFLENIGYKKNHAS
jgi:hypothetical protein